MAWIIVGLGNPGEEYTLTRHNAGRLAIELFAQKNNFSEWRDDTKAKARVAKGEVNATPVVLVAPDTFMNKSGSAVVKYVKSVKAAEKMIVVYDDLDLPIGKIKISFDRGSGGHKGLESITRAVKTKEFARIRIGVSRATASGKIKKPQGEDDVIDFILAKFKPSEQEELKKVFKRVGAALESIITDGLSKAMGEFNQS